MGTLFILCWRERRFFNRPIDGGMIPMKLLSKSTWSDREMVNERNKEQIIFNFKKADLCNIRCYVQKYLPRCED